MQIINKPVKIVAYTTTCKVRGIYNLNENSRLTDVLNSKMGNTDFLPIKDAQITNLRTGESTDVSFLSLNRSHIEVIFEDQQ